MEKKKVSMWKECFADLKKWGKVWWIKILEYVRGKEIKNMGEELTLKDHFLKLEEWKGDKY